MAVEVVLLNSESTTNIQTNFERIEAALENVVGRQGLLPNSMEADLDLDSNDILNVKNIEADSVSVGGVSLIPGSVVGIPANSVGTSQLVDESVTLVKLAPEVITLIEAEAESSTISLLSVLTAGEVTDVRTGTNSIDITAKLKTLIADAPTGSTIDATMLNGTVTFTDDIFGGQHTRPITLKTGRVDILKDFNSGEFKIPSLMKWDGPLTNISPLVDITSIPNEQGVSQGLIGNYIGGADRTCFGNGTSLTVSDATGIHIGTAIVVFGNTPDFTMATTLTNNINSSVTSFALTGTAGTNNPALLMIRIDSEFMYGLYESGVFDLTTNAYSGRGKLGTTAASHSAGATVVTYQGCLRKVVGISGNVLTLDSAIDVNFSSGGIFRFGATQFDVTLGEVDGGFDPSGPPAASNWLCFGCTLGSDFSFKARRLRRGQHGGLMLNGTISARVDVQRVEDNGDAGSSLGASAWIFGSNKDSVINIDTMTNGNIAVAVDNKSSGIVYYGLNLPNDGFEVNIGQVINHNEGADITASHHGVCHIGYSETSGSSAGVFDGTPQQTGAIVPDGVGIVVDKMLVFRSPTGNALSGATVNLEGQTQRIIDTDLVLGVGVSLPADSDVAVNFTATGALTGDRVQIDILSPTAIPAGCLLSHAYIVSSDTVRLIFRNVTAIGQTLPAQTFKANIVGPW